MIIHIAGPSGSGKTTLGKRLKEHYKDKVIIKDLDDLLWKEFIPWQEKTDITATDFFTNFESNYQEYIDTFIKQNKGKTIIFVGINTFIMGEMQQFKGIDKKFPKAFFDLRADHKYYIDIPVEQVMKQKFYRMMDDFCNSKDIIFTDLLENENETRKNITDDIMRQTHMKEVRMQTEKWNKFYRDKGYEYLSNDEIFNRIIEQNGGKYYKKYLKYKSKYLKGGNKTNILILFNTYINELEDENGKQIQYYSKLLEGLGKIYVYNFKFTSIKNNFTFDDYYFENAATDIRKFIKDNHIENCIMVTLGHASPYGLYTVDKYPELCQKIVCYPLRLYMQASLDRRIWKFKDQGGWKKYVSKKYDIEDYYINPSNNAVKTLLKNPEKEEIDILYHISDMMLQKQSDKIPNTFKIPTVLFTRLDMDVDSIIKLNFERKAIADMKGIVDKESALYTSMMWNFDRVKYDKNLLDKNKDNDNLQIKYYIANLEDDRNLYDSVKS